MLNMSALSSNFSSLFLGVGVGFSQVKILSGFWRTCDFISSLTKPLFWEIASIPEHPPFLDTVHLKILLFFDGRLRYFKGMTVVFLFSDQPFIFYLPNCLSWESICSCIKINNSSHCSDKMQISAVAPPPIYRNMQANGPHPSLLGIDGSSRSTINTTMQAPRRKFVDEGKLRKVIKHFY